MVESPVLRASAAPDSLIALDRCPYHRQSACRMYWAWHSLSSCFQPKACRVKSSTQYVSGRFADHRESAAGPPRGKRERTCVVDETSATSFGSLERGGTRRLVKLDSDQQRSDPFKSFDLTRYGFILLRLGVSASLRLMHEARRLLIRRYQRTGNVRIQEHCNRSLRYPACKPIRFCCGIVEQILLLHCISASFFGFTS